MEEETISVRKLAKAAGPSPSLIQKMRSGEQEDVRIINFIRIAKAGLPPYVGKGTRIPLNAQP